MTTIPRMGLHDRSRLAPRPPLSPFTWEPAELGADEVEIAVTHCGLCHSDIHLIDDGWKISSYPLRARPRDRRPRHRVGQRRRAPRRRAARRRRLAAQRVPRPASSASTGHENLCPTQTATCVGHHGGFAERIRTDGRFAFAAPRRARQRGRGAAPLRRRHGVLAAAPLPRRRHLRSASSASAGSATSRSLMLARLRLRDHRVLVLARASATRRWRWARTHFVPPPMPRELHSARGALRSAALHGARAARLDHLPPDAAPQRRALPARRAAGRAPDPRGAAVPGQKSITASEIGDRATIAEMLRFAARHRIAPMVERMPLADVNAAIERVRRNEARYRVVLDVA